jgi:hypothetical protein
LGSLRNSGVLFSDSGSPALMMPNERKRSSDLKPTSCACLPA